jgi:hypothetical protein
MLVQINNSPLQVCVSTCLTGTFSSSSAQGLRLVFSLSVTPIATVARDPLSTNVQYAPQNQNSFKLSKSELSHNSRKLIWSGRRAWISHMLVGNVQMRKQDASALLIVWHVRALIKFCMRMLNHVCLRIALRLDQRVLFPSCFKHNFVFVFGSATGPTVLVNGH